MVWSSFWDWGEGSSSHDQCLSTICWHICYLFSCDHNLNIHLFIRLCIFYLLMRYIILVTIFWMIKIDISKKISIFIADIWFHGIMGSMRSIMMIYCREMNPVHNRYMKDDKDICMCNFHCSLFNGKCNVELLLMWSLLTLIKTSKYEIESAS